MELANLIHIMSYIIEKPKMKGIDIDGVVIYDQEIDRELNLTMGVVTNLKSI
jgi:hypothetical protein